MNKHYENIKEQLNNLQELVAKFYEYGSTNDLYKHALIYKESIQNINKILLDEKIYIELITKNNIEQYRELSDIRDLIADLLNLLKSLLINIDAQDNYLIKKYAKDINDRLENFEY